MVGVQYISMKEVSQEEIAQAVAVLEQAQTHFDDDGRFEQGTEMSHARATLEVEFLEE